MFNWLVAVRWHLFHISMYLTWLVSQNRSKMLSIQMGFFYLLVVLLVVIGKLIKPQRLVFPLCSLSFFLSLSFSIYCLALAFEHYRQVYIVHSGLQDESLQVTISKLP